MPYRDSEPLPCCELCWGGNGCLPLLCRAPGWRRMRSGPECWRRSGSFTLPSRKRCRTRSQSWLQRSSRRRETSRYPLCMLRIAVPGPRVLSFSLSVHPLSSGRLGFILFSFCSCKSSFAVLYIKVTREVARLYLCSTTIYFLILRSDQPIQ